MKPDVVFFGDNVPKPIVQDTFDRVENSDGIMILGTQQCNHNHTLVAIHAVLTLTHPNHPNSHAYHSGTGHASILPPLLPQAHRWKCIRPIVS